MASDRTAGDSLFASGAESKLARSGSRTERVRLYGADSRDVSCTALIAKNQSLGFPQARVSLQ